MSNFPSIEEFDSGQVTATRLEDVDDTGNLLDAGESNFLAREQAVLGDDAQFFQPLPSQGEQTFFAGGNEGLISPVHLWIPRFLTCQMKMYTNLSRVSHLLARRYAKLSPVPTGIGIDGRTALVIWLLRPWHR